MKVDQIRREIINLEFSDLVEIENTIKTAKNRFFRVGTKVSFLSSGFRIHGVVSKINPKSIGVTTDGGGWKVSKSLLRVEV